LPFLLFDAAHQLEKDEILREVQLISRVHDYYYKNHILIIIRQSIKKGKAIPVTGHEGP
jgi:hypothetical protein